MADVFDLGQQTYDYTATASALLAGTGLPLPSGMVNLKPLQPMLPPTLITSVFVAANFLVFWSFFFAIWTSPFPGAIRTRHPYLKLGRLAGIVPQVILLALTVDTGRMTGYAEVTPRSTVTCGLPTIHPKSDRATGNSPWLWFIELRTSGKTPLW